MQLPSAMSGVGSQAAVRDIWIMDSRATTSLAADHVIGGFARETLSSALASTHRAGFGPQTRVIDSSRGAITQQVERMGLLPPWDEPPAPDVVLIVVNAPGRTAIVADLFARLGAAFVVFADRRGAGRPVEDTVVALAPDVRIGEGAGSGSDA